MGRTLAIFFSTLILFTIIYCQIYQSVKLNNNTWIYPLDDTYIHMSIGKNLAGSGQWGVTKYEFSSSSSSILYTLLIALSYKIFGVNEYVPLVLNAFSGVAIFLVLWIIFTKENFSAVTVLISSIMLVFLTPLPAMIISGMEHTLQILIDLTIVYVAAKVLESTNQQTKFMPFLFLLSALCVMVRFEGIFLIFIIGGLLIVKEKFKAGILVWISGLFPVVLFGIYSISNGSYLIPNSLLMKGEKPTMNFVGLVQFTFGWLDKLKINPHLLTLMLSLCIYFIYLSIYKINIWSKQCLMVLMVVGTMIIHLTLAKTGWFFRYEAYLVFLAIFIITWMIDDILKLLKSRNLTLLQKLTGLFLFLVLVFPLYSRGKDAMVSTVAATRNIYEQQYQMAAFLKKYYNNSTVAANDIGAICYFTDIKLFDIFGLGSKEIIKLRMDKQFDQKHIYEITEKKGVQIAIIYEDWFIDKVPTQWKKSGSWKITDNVILGGDSVSFFSTDLKGPEGLKRNLEEFTTSLPKRVHVHLQ